LEFFGGHLLPRTKINLHKKSLYSEFFNSAPFFFIFLISTMVRFIFVISDPGILERGQKLGVQLAFGYVIDVIGCIKGVSRTFTNIICCKFVRFVSWMRAHCSMSFQPTEKDMFDTHNCQPSGIHLSALPSVIEKSTDEESMLIFELSKKKFHLKKKSHPFHYQEIHFLNQN